MGLLVFQQSSGGTINVQGTNTASAFTWTIPASTDTFVGLAATQTLTNKTLTSPVISGGTIDNAVIGGTTAVAGSFTTVTAGTSVTTPFVTSAAATNLLLKSAGTTAITIDTSQNVGVGVTSPSARIEAVSTTSGVRATYDASNGGFIEMKNNGTVNAFVCSYYGGGSYQPLAFFVGGSERSRIDTSGNLLVGKTASNNTGAVGVENRPDGTIDATLSSSTSSTSTLNVYSTGASAYRFYVDMGGTIHATSIVITAISDQRLKENVRDIDTGLNSIMALKPRRFDWKEGKGQDKKNAAGFIAQEFEEVFPECVGTSKAGGDGIEYKNINHETLIPTLVKAIQEQQAMITTLQTQVTALKG